MSNQAPDFQQGLAPIGGEPAQTAPLIPTVPDPPATTAPPTLPGGGATDVASSLDPSSGTEARTLPADLPTPPAAPLSTDLTAVADRLVARRGEKVDALTRSITPAIATNPDEAARYARLSAATGLDPYLLKESPDVRAAAEQDQTLRGINIDSLIKSNPMAAQWLSDPANADVAHDDIPALKQLEDSWSVGSASLYLGRSFVSAPFSVLQGFGGAAAGVFELLGEALQAPGDALGAWGLGLSGAGRGLRALGREASSGATGFEQLAKEVQGPSNSQPWLVRQAGSGMVSAGQLLGMIPLAQLGPAAVSTAFGVVAGGQGYQEGKQAGLSTPLAATYGGTVGWIEKWTEDAPMEVLFKTPLGKLTLKRFANYMWKEGRGEEIATTFQKWAQDLAIHPDKTFGQFVAELPEAWAATLVGVAVGGGVNLAMVHTINNVATRAQRQNTKAFFDALSSGVTDSKLHKRLPEKTRDFIKMLREGGGPQEVFVDAQHFATYFQEQGMDPVAVASDLLGSPKQFNDALALGGDLVIPVERYAEKLAGTQHAIGLAPDLKLSTGELSPREADLAERNKSDDQRRVDRMMKHVLEVAEKDASVNQVYEDFYREQIGAGELPSAAAPRAMLQAARYGTRAQRFPGETAMSLYTKDSPVRMRRALPSVQLGGVDASLETVLNALRTQPTSTAAGFQPGTDVMWRNKDTDIPVKFVELQPELGSDGRQYAKVSRDGQESFVPVDELTQVEDPLQKFAAALKGLNIDLNTMTNEQVQNLVFEPHDAPPGAEVLLNQQLPESITVDGIERPTRNSEGRQIHPMEDGVRNFWRWFGDSKVVDTEGRPLVVYHGTEKAGFSVFDPLKSGDNTGRNLEGFYFTESKVNAATYSGTRSDASPSSDPDFDPLYDGEPGNYATFLSLQNPYEIDVEGRNFAGVSEDNLEGDPWFHIDAVVRRAQKAGHDGVIATNITDEGRHGQGYGWGQKTFVAFRPEQIKSATDNTGAFDPTDSRILNQLTLEQQRTMNDVYNTALQDFDSQPQENDTAEPRTLLQSAQVRQQRMRELGDAALPAEKAFLQFARDFVDAHDREEGNSDRPLADVARAYFVWRHPPQADQSEIRKNIDRAPELVRDLDGMQLGRVVDALNVQRRRAFNEASSYLMSGVNDGGLYTDVEAAMMLGVLSKYYIVYDANSDTARRSTFTPTSLHPLSSFSGGIASLMAERLRAGEAPVKAYEGAVVDWATKAEDSDGNPEEGWVKFEQSEDRADHERLNRATATSKGNWCTGGAISTAAQHLRGGDFYVYFRNKEAAIAIRMDGTEQVGEVSGSLPGQQLGPEDYPILQKFQKDNPKVDGLQDVISDANRAEWAKKSIETGVFDTRLYRIEVSESSDTLTLKTERANKRFNNSPLISKKDAAKLAKIAAGKESSLTLDDYAKAGELYLRPESMKKLQGLRSVSGSVDMVAGGILPDTLEVVGGTLYLSSGASAPAVTTVGGNLHLYEGASAPAVTTVGGNLYLYDGASVPAVTTVGGNLYLPKGASAPALTTVGGDLTLGTGASAPAVTTVGGDLTLHDGASAPVLTTVGGTLHMGGVVSAPALTTVGGNLQLHEGASVPALTTVGGYLHLGTGASAPAVTTVGGELRLHKGASAPALTTVGGELRLYEGVSAPAVTTVGWNLYLYDGASVPALTSVGGSLRMYGSARANAVTTIGGNLRLYDGASAPPNLRTVGGQPYVRTLLQSTQPALWYSHLSKVLAEKLPTKGSAVSMLQAIEAFERKGEFKAEELRWSGISQWLAQQDGVVTRDQILEQLALNAVEVREVTLHPADYTPEEFEALRRVYVEAEVERARDEHLDEYDTLDGFDEESAHEAATTNFDETADDIVAGDANAVRHSKWQLPGGTNYREVLLTLPIQGHQFQALINDEWVGFDTRAEAVAAAEKVGIDIIHNPGFLREVSKQAIFRSGHFAEPNIVAHTRLNDRVDADGKRVLFVEEVQNDYGKELRLRAGALAETEELEKGSEAFKARVSKLIKTPEKLGLPNLPFATSYPLLIMKRVLRMAVDGGYDSVAWVTGAQTQDRYDLSKQVDAIDYDKNDDGTYALSYQRGGGRTEIGNAIPESKLADYVGKQVAEKIVNGEGDVRKHPSGAPYTRLSGIDLKFGGEWAVNLYDKQIPNELNKYVKKWGGKVGTVNVPQDKYKGYSTYEVGQGAHNDFAVLGVKPDGERVIVNQNAKDHADAARIVDELKDAAKGMPQPGITITPQMREALGTQPQPLFQTARGAVRLAPGFRQIELFRDANLSTILHELSHTWLEELQRDAASPNAPQQLKDDWAAVQKELGIVGDGPIPVAAHEQWAGWGEQYFREGKAPSAGLRDVMYKFRQWMLSIYKTVQEVTQHLGRPIPKNISDVFDRLLATDEEIEAAREQYDAFPMFTTPEEAGMTDAEWTAYGAATAKDRQAAVEALHQRVMADLAHEDARWWKSAQEEMQAAVVGDLEPVPVYKALREMTARAAPADVKLSKQAIEERYGKDYLRRLSPQNLKTASWVYAAEGGVHPDVAAARYGFSSGDELIHALLQAVPFKAAVEQEVEARMFAKYGNIMHDGSLPDAAAEAIYNEQHEKLLATELRILRRKQRALSPILSALGKEEAKARREQMALLDAPVPTAILKDMARREVGDLRVREIRPHSYLQAAAKAGRRALDAAKRGDFATAAEEKQRQIVNQHMYREAIKAQREVAKMEKHLRNMTRSPARKRIGLAGEHWLEQLDKLLADFSFAPRSTTAYAQGLADFAEQVERDTGQQIAIAPDLLDESRRQNYRDLQLDALRGLYDTVLSIEHVARKVTKVLATGRAYEFNTAVENLVAQAVASITNVRPLPETEAALSQSERIFALTKGAFDSNLRPEKILERLDGGPSGPWHDMFWNPAVDAQTRRQELQALVLRPIAEAEKSLHKAWADSLNETVYLPSIGASLQRRTLIGMALNVGNAGNKAKLQGGGLWLGERHVPQITDQMLAEALGALRAEDWGLVQTIWDAVDQLWEPLNDLNKRALGLPLARVEATPVETRFGTLRGGYWPAVSDARHSKIGEKQENADALITDVFSPQFPKAATAHSFREARTTAVYPVQLDWQRVLSTHVNKATTDIAYHEWVKQARRLLEAQAVKKTLQNRLGDHVYRALEEWLVHQVQPIFGGYRANASVVGVGNTLQANLAISALGFKVALAGANMVTAPVQAMHQVTPANILRGVTRFLSNPRQQIEAVKALSGEMRFHTDSMDQSFALVLNSIAGKTTLRATVARVSMEIHKHVERWVSTAIWLGKYHQEIDAGKLPEDAIRLADKTIRTTQMTGFPKDLSSFERDQRFKWYTMFIGPMIVLQNEMRGAIAAESGGTGIRARALISPQVLATALATWILPSVLFELASGRGPDDDEDWWLWALRRILLAPVQMIPLVREFGNGLEQALGGGRYYSSRANPVAEALGSGLKAVTKTKAAISGDAEFGDVALAWARASGLLVGLPTGQVALSTQFAADVLTGAYDLEGPQDLRYLIYRRETQ